MKLNTVNFFSKHRRDDTLKLILIALLYMRTVYCGPCSAESYEKVIQVKVTIWKKDKGNWQISVNNNSYGNAARGGNAFAGTATASIVQVVGEEVVSSVEASGNYRA